MGWTSIMLEYKRLDNDEDLDVDLSKEEIIAFRIFQKYFPIYWKNVTDFTKTTIANRIDDLAYLLEEDLKEDSLLFKAELEYEVEQFSEEWKDFYSKNDYNLSNQLLFECFICSKLYCAVTSTKNYDSRFTRSLKFLLQEVDSKYLRSNDRNFVIPTILVFFTELFIYDFNFSVRFWKGDINLKYIFSTLNLFLNLFFGKIETKSKDFNNIQSVLCLSKEIKDHLFSPEKLYVKWMESTTKSSFYPTYYVYCFLRGLEDNLEDLSIDTLVNIYGELEN